MSSTSSTPADNSCDSIDVLDLKNPLDDIVKGQGEKDFQKMVGRCPSPQWSDAGLDTLEELEHFLNNFCPGDHKEFDDFIECADCLNAISLAEIAPENQSIKVTKKKNAFKITDNLPKVSASTRSPLNKVNTCHGGVVSKRFPTTVGRRSTR